MISLIACNKPQDETIIESNELTDKTTVPHERLHVVFVNPGYPETFWLMTSEFMQSVAKDLEIDLEIIYSNRDHIAMVKHVKEVAERDVKPDYMIVVNEKPVAVEFFDIIEPAGIKTILMSNDLNSEQYRIAGSPRERYKNWLGVMVPDNEYAGVRIAESVIEKGLRMGHDETIEMIAIGGSRATPASIDRLKGLDRVLSNNPIVDLKQVVYGEWIEKTAYEQTSGLLSRYPECKIIWTANDPMAIGAIKASKDSGLKPGEDLYISGLNWSEEAFEAIRNDEMVASIGGHFTLGGCVLMTLYDHHNGFDFADEDGLKMNLKLFGTIDKSNVNQDSKFIDPTSWESIDFKKFTKTDNTSIEKYDFSVEMFMNELE